MVLQLKSRMMPYLITIPLLNLRQQILDRGERLDVLVERTDGLASQAFAFKREARTAHRTFYWANVRLRVFVAIGCLLGLYILVALICSPTFHCH